MFFWPFKLNENACKWKPVGTFFYFNGGHQSDLMLWDDFFLQLWPKVKNCFVYAWQTFWIFQYKWFNSFNNPKKYHIIIKLPLVKAFLMNFRKKKAFLLKLQKVCLVWKKQFRVFQCKFHGDELVLEQKVTPMTPLKWKVTSWS